MTAKRRIVRVAVPKPLPQLFDYQVPDDVAPPAVGGRVRVPFGRQTLTGICVTLDPDDPHEPARPVKAVLDGDNVLGEELFRLALWLADYYQYPLGEVLGTLLPAEARRGGALKIRRERCWQLRQPATPLQRPPTRAPRQAALLAHLQACGGSATQAALQEAGFGTPLIRAVAAKGLIVAGETVADETVADDTGSIADRRSRLTDQGSDTGPVVARAGVADRPLLNAEQKAALQALTSQGNGFTATLLEGVTGSGKTEIYLQRIEEVRGRGRQVLVLVPEIALTPQTLDRFEARFGSAATLHSGMTDQQRLQTWLRCRSGEVGILIGTRSAVLTPFHNLGLIVVDEEHDGSFKQQEGLRYSARDVAVKRAHDLDIPLLLGSATPSFESLHNVRTGRYRHLELKHRAGGASLPGFHLLDIRGHSLVDGISDRLRRIIADHLDAAGQALIFLNRRGFAPSYLCSACGWQAVCDHCDMRMTLHRRPPGLICHHCGLRRSLPDGCPACGQARLIAVGLGTQRTEAGLEQLFPGVPLLRIDRDTTRSQRRLQEHLRIIHEGKPAILIGTQMLAKGHHFPNVTLVAIINADAGFCSADFKAPERTAQLIVQVAGRAGRAERPGQVWIQTYQPENPMLRALIDHGYQGFAVREMASREAAGLPPFRPMALLRAESEQAAAATAFLESCRDALRQHAGPDLEILGPAQAPVQKVANRHRFQLLLLADTRGSLHRMLRAHLPATAPRNVRWSLDIDPYDTF